MKQYDFSFIARTVSNEDSPIGATNFFSHVYRTINSPDFFNIVEFLFDYREEIHHPTF